MIFIAESCSALAKCVTYATKRELCTELNTLVTIVTTAAKAAIGTFTNLVVKKTTVTRKSTASLVPTAVTVPRLFIAKI
jgi:hypothetical protein